MPLDSSAFHLGINMDNDPLSTSPCGFLAACDELNDQEAKYGGVSKPTSIPSFG